MGTLDLYSTVRELAGWLELNGWGVVRVVGPDRVRFLQGQASNDLMLLQPGRGLYTAFCTPTGHLLSDAYLLDEGEALLLLLPAATFETLLSRLQALIILDEVELISLREVVGVLSLQGAQSAMVLEELGMEAVPAEELAHQTVIWQGMSIRVVRCDRSGSGGYDLYLAYEQMEEFKTALVTAGAPPIPPALYEVLRYEAGIPLYGVDMDEKVIASEMGAAFEAQYISYTKGCYTGQEVLMRIRTRGHTNRTWVPLQVEVASWQRGLPSRGDRIEALDRPDAGWITGAVFSPSLGAVLAWGFVRNAYILPGTRLQIVHGQELLPAVVLAKPPYSRFEH